MPRPILHILSPLLLAATLACPAAAQSWEMPKAQPTPEDGFESAMEGVMENLFNRFQPHFEGLAREMERAVNDYRPMLDTMAALMDDIENYQRPERLENGDIIIRRKPGAPPPPPLDEIERFLPEAPPSDHADPRKDPLPLPGGEIEL